MARRRRRPATNANTQHQATTTTTRSAIAASSRFRRAMSNPVREGVVTRMPFISLNSSLRSRMS